MNEWYTPYRYVNAAREVMGGIDLDPASCALANETVQAARYYTKEENGLTQPWFGRVWLNPPFGRTREGYHSNIGIFTTKLVEEYWAGNITQAVLLSTARTDSSWFHLLWNFPICFTDHVVGFYRPEKKKILNQSGHMHGTIFVYLGSNEQKFIDIFSQFGRIAKVVDTPRQIMQPLRLWEVQSSQ